MARPGRPRLTVVALAVALVVLAGLGLSLAVSRGFGCTFAPAGTCVRVLFIGNSYTSVNDLPRVFARLAASGGVSVEVAMIAPGGASLAGHAADAGVSAAIAGGSGGVPWTAVVLQEQSEVPAVAQWRDTQMAPAASALARSVLMAGSRPYLLETWAHRDGLPSVGLDYPAMQTAISEAYRSIARQTGSGLVPAGDVWRRALASGHAGALWADDGSHPSLAGTYLVACSLYLALTGASPVGLSETAGLDPAVAAALRRIAAGE